MGDVEEKSIEQAANNGNGNVTENETNQESAPESTQEQEVEEGDKDDGDGNENTGQEDSLTALEKSIIRQIEYYFGDSNLYRDKFLQEQIANDKEGWVTISVLLTFRRLAALTTDIDVIVDALQKSDEGLIEIHEDRTKIRRHPERPLPEPNEERRKEIRSRTAYAKGFPLDATLNEILEFFFAFEKVSSVNMRKYLDKPTKQYKFKGSVFVTFETPEHAKAFIEKDEVSYKERQLIRKWKANYIEEKMEEINKKNKMKNKKLDKQNKEEPNTLVLPKKTVVKFQNADPDVSREMLRDAINKVISDLQIAFIDHSKGKTAGFIRFKAEDNAVDFLAKLQDKTLKVKEDCELPMELVEGEEEENYLKKAAEHMRSVRNNNKGHQRTKRKGGFKPYKHSKRHGHVDD